MIRTIYLSIDFMAEYGVMTASRHVDAAEIAQIVESAKLQPANGTEPPLYDAEAAREAWEVVFGRSVHHRDVDPGSRASQDRERLPVVVAKKVAKPPKHSGVFHDCVVCGTSFEAAYMAHGHLSARKTCSYACMAILQSRNAAASRGTDWNTSIVPSQKVLSGESTG